MTRAMLLTAGFGQRLLPLTLSQPKPTIPVLGRPLVVQILNWLGRKGVEEAVLNLHHLPDDVRRVVGDGLSPGVPKVHYSHEEKILGTAGGLRHAAELLSGEAQILVCNSDFLSDIDVRAALDTHRSSDCAATLVLIPPRPGYSIVHCDADSRVISLAGKPRVDAERVAGEYLFTGCHIINQEILARIPDNGPSDIVRDVYRELAAEGRLGAFVHDGFWWEFGSPELYLEGSLELLRRPSAELSEISKVHDAIRVIEDAQVAVGPGAILHDEARFNGHAAVGYASHISEGAHIEDSVIMPETWIGPGCRLRRAVIGQGVELPAGARCENMLVCNDPDPTMDLPPCIRRESGMLIHAFAPSE